jgi:hypothetical protein
MSIREIMNFYNKIDIKDKDLAVPGAASFPSGPSPLPSFAKGSETPIKSFSDYEYEDLFGYGVSVVNSFAGSEIKINSTLEKLMNDPLFGAEQKKASTKRAYDMIKKKNEENLNWWDKNIAGPTAFN